MLIVIAAEFAACLESTSSQSIATNGSKIVAFVFALSIAIASLLALFLINGALFLSISSYSGTEF